jgi:hypothetical protein
MVVVRVVGASKDTSNSEFRNIKVSVEVFVPLT